MGIEGTMINEMSEKGKCYMIWLLCGNFKIKQMNKDKKNKNRVTVQRANRWFSKENKKGE